MLFVLRFAQVREAFRQAEMESICECLGIDNKSLGMLPLDTPFSVVELCDLQTASRILQRSVLLMNIYKLFAVASSLSELHNLVRNIDFLEYIEKPFRFRVDSFMKTFSDKEQVDMINSFSYMPLKGPVKLDNPLSTTFTILYDHVKGIWMLGEQVQVSQNMREQIDHYSLKKRDYLGTTSMDAEMGLVMANIAKARPGSLAYDPFVGTGSLLFAASHFGALAIGSDIDGRQLRGGRVDQQQQQQQQSSLHTNIAQYGLADRILGGLVFDICQHPWRDDGSIFDAIIADPPYGVRAGAKKISKIRERNVPAELRSVLYPQTGPYELDDLVNDLLQFASQYLAPGGRLVFWFPQDVKSGNIFDPAPLYTHASLVLKYSIPQQMRMICRWLLVYEKKQ